MNPLLKLDYPDPDVIRVGDTYYMVSTTMYFMPGCEILESKDLVNWSHATYVYDVLEETDHQKLEQGKNAYGKGMWAASLRYHQGKFYICFVANDTHKNYLYSSDSIYGLWKKQEIEGFYHDSSLLFDDDGKIYIVYGNTDIYITELDENLSGPKKGGFHKCVITEQGEYCLGYEGAHFYKIDGYYYIFLIHSPSKLFFRKEACFWTKSLQEPFVGGDIFDETLGFRGMGVAQGGIVDTPEGKWYGILFQDRGAVGRIPVLVPVRFENHIPIMGDTGKLPQDWKLAYESDAKEEPLVGSDDFSETYETTKDGKKYGSFGLRSFWQFNHIPDLRGVSLKPGEKKIQLTHDNVVDDLTQAKNTLTQRMKFPGCKASVLVDGSLMKDGDIAGICALQSQYGLVGLQKEKDSYQIVMMERTLQDGELVVTVGERLSCLSKQIRLSLKASFDPSDVVSFFFEEDGVEKKIGTEHNLYFTLDHFTGTRVGLFSFATKEIGGMVSFSDFTYEE